MVKIGIKDCLIAIGVAAFGIPLSGVAFLAHGNHEQHTNCHTGAPG